MNISRKITISAASAVAAVLAATGIAMAAPTAPGPGGGLMAGDANRMPTAQADWMDEMHADNADWMDEMHADGWTDAGMDAMHARMDEMLEKYPQMQQHMESNAPLRGPAR